ncbi:trimeric intracellular cation channel family protein [Tumebacillus permanentifrigoris]|uniref:Putative membrane protein YeiH n=1 Tax=Tumebacillus permanentifrigoris TaxID=378543 RepID=A0A316DV38_9BACL|nr:trimeric intracellular cation channel family protein [Tumebacillus permanentifrigoris]PWK13052.1 putative membrane protein YeiH [Tumebacillus permanentifrigoris]
MAWEVFNVLGTIAFAISGAIVAREEEFDILGVYVLGFVTAFGGGIIRNLLIGIPVTAIWGQNTLFTVALVSMTLVFFAPSKWIAGFKRWIDFFDAIGLAAFAIQGAFYAHNMQHPMSAILIAGVLTGIGGGIIRDVLAGRQPLVLKDEIYAFWAILAGLAIGFDLVGQDWQLYVLFLVVVILRLMSLRYRWRLPKRALSDHEFRA